MPTQGCAGQPAAKAKSVGALLFSLSFMDRHRCLKRHLYGTDAGNATFGHVTYVFSAVRQHLATSEFVYSRGPWRICGYREEERSTTMRDLNCPRCIQ